MIDQGELIERWDNAQRVLVAMPEHDRQNHWNMAKWGVITDCGTIACAAGHCGLDPWFRDRGFKLDFTEFREAKISDVASFFGLEGSARIFFNSAQRSVEAVIAEVRSYADELRKISALFVGRKLPRVGEEWPEQGGVFAGARLGINGSPSYLLIAGPQYDGWLEWCAAMAWAAQLSVNGHADFALPSRTDGYPLFDNVRALFQREAYWLGEQHASGSSFAWGQYFNYGHQLNWYKTNKLRARAVRRLPIQ